MKHSHHICWGMHYLFGLVSNSFKMMHILFYNTYFVHYFDPCGRLSLSYQTGLEVFFL